MTSNGRLPPFPFNRAKTFGRFGSTKNMLAGMPANKSRLSPALLLMAHLKNILQGKLHDSGVHRTSDLPESIAIVQGRRIADRDASPDGGNSGKA